MSLQNLMSERERRQFRGAARFAALTAAHAKLPHVREYVAAALAGSVKRGWYARARISIAERYGPNAPRFTALLAAMSPRTSLQLNVSNAVAVFTAWDKAGRPHAMGAIWSTLLDADIGDILPAWYPNIVRALSATTDIELSGPKVHSFHQNLLGNLFEVTNDGWMFLFAGVSHGKLSGSLNKSGPGKSAIYLAASLKCRAAAKILNWQPAEIQECIWSFTKTAYELASREGKLVADLVKAGDIDDTLIGSTPDVHTLFARTAAVALSAAQPHALQRSLRAHLIRAAKRIDAKLIERRSANDEPNF